MLKRQPIKKFKRGTMSFRVFPAFTTSIIPENFIQVPYKILYDEGDIDPLHVFNCQMNLLKSLLSIAHIDLKKGPITDKLSSAELRYLLGKTVDAAESLAKGLDKEKVVVSSTLEPIIDVFVEKDFIYGKKCNIVGYKGVKRDLR